MTIREFLIKVKVAKPKLIALFPAESGKRVGELAKEGAMFKDICTLCHSWLVYDDSLSIMPCEFFLRATLFNADMDMCVVHPDGLLIMLKMEEEDIWKRAIVF